MQGYKNDSTNQTPPPPAVVRGAGSRSAPNRPLWGGRMQVARLQERQAKQTQRVFKDPDAYEPRTPQAGRTTMLGSGL